MFMAVFLFTENILLMNAYRQNIEGFLFLICVEVERMSASTLLSIQKNVARYGLSTLLVLGNFGNIFTMLIFIRSAKRRINSCSLYLLSASISNWIVINTALVSNIVGVDHIDPQNTSNIICKLRWSTVHALLMLSRSFSKFIICVFDCHIHCLCIVITACIDRWALCSNNPVLRAFSRPHNAFRVILILLVVWTIIPIHLAIFFNNSTGHCIAMPESYAFFYAIYSLIVIGILPLVLMIIFSLLAWHNLQLIRSRVVPIDPTIRNIKIHKRDRDLMKMLSGEVLAYCITTIPYPINLIYSVSTSSITAYKTPTRLAMESLIGYIVSPLLNFMYCCAQFYGKKKTILSFK